MTAALEEGRSIDIVDYELSPALYREMTTLTPWSAPPPAKRVLLLSRPLDDGEAATEPAEWERAGASVTRAVHKVPVFWEDFTGGMPPEFTETTKRWILEGAAASGAK
jgi:hypothetical protein